MLGTGKDGPKDQEELNSTGWITFEALVAVVAQPVSGRSSSDFSSCGIKRKNDRMRRAAQHTEHRTPNHKKIPAGDAAGIMDCKK